MSDVAEKLRVAAQEWADGKIVMWDTDVALVAAINEAIAHIEESEKARVS